ncbi:hypothetical protein [Motiliproteus sp. MSK22-1]|uniref:hypothetical protein n=1 Tax=Motiliproteus sp. MSK22-1 TaxID=1897630 RepID=UPI00097777EF|nr:hypothetical protein [Motiliproteus sp. MSK22-1]OMH29154.1 hypothetical protein BGP75_20635 [Motiliproteus sp. MSK22-1]
MKFEQLQQCEVRSFDEAVEALCRFRDLERRTPTSIIFKFPVGVLPVDVLNEYYQEAEGLGLSVNYAA